MVLEKAGGQLDRSCKKIQKYYIESRRREMSYIYYREGRLTELVKFCGGNTF
jgi:hypothetical protein